MSGVALGEGLVDSITRHHEDRLRRKGASELVRLVLGQEIDEARLPESRSDMLWFESMLSSACMVGAAKIWRRTRVVYDVNPDFGASLVDMELDAEFPGEVLKRLPHPDPVFVFREPHIRTMPSGEDVAVRGFLVTCRPSMNSVASTMHVDLEDDETPYLVVMIVDVLPKSGKDKRRGFVELKVPRRDGKTTVGQIIGEIGIFHGTHDGYATPNDETALKRFLSEAALIAVSHMLYACCDNPDAEEASAPAHATRVKKGSKPKRQTRVLRLGWRLGPAIRRFNAGIERLRALGPSTGRSLLPHVRRGHPHTVLYGVAKSLRKVKWFPPTLVNADRFGAEAEGIIVPFE
ncbi:hypothetical protein ABZ281_07640 [Streptomyces sp. NPDC006265]|uniref:hypothetical protein n=1 Tax=Streptomyces sp. NPDC006265 TaxID=3156740 RepID=UPI00339F1FB9